MVRIILVIYMAVSFVGCSREERKESLSLSIDPTKAYTYVREIAEIGPRPSGSEGAARNVQYICGKLKELNVPFQEDRWDEKTPIGKVAFCNVTAEIRGKKDAFILIGAHYDTKKLETVPDFHGANDGASGTGLLIAIIEAIVKSGAVPPYTIRFAFFDGEECFLKYGPNDGLFGSRRMAARIAREKEKCVAMILLDMVGDRDLKIQIPSNGDDRLAESLFRAAEKRGTGKYFCRGATAITDDHSPFLDAGIPAIDIIDFSYGPSNLYWHSGEDRMDKISVESLSVVGDAVLEMTMNFEE